MCTGEILEIEYSQDPTGAKNFITELACGLGALEKVQSLVEHPRHIF